MVRVTTSPGAGLLLEKVAVNPAGRLLIVRATFIIKLSLTVN